ncbi:MAG: hypothetical protein EGP69_09425 [[Ruminococcus] faecis]|nr:hypothetical protein [Mediterraneibacter faecis]
MDSKINENKILNAILNFEIKEIDSETRFWMIRTKKGYFYDEFIANRFVAVAWNIITKDTVISEQTKGTIANRILTDYPGIKRPTTAINKCVSFINEIKENDIIVIPSEGSRYITFARAGEYYEEKENTVEVEKTVIDSIENNTVLINEIACPYLKRRHIDIIMTVKSEDLNPNLFRAISNHHGISNLDGYAKNILSTIYNVYTYKNDINIVFNVRKTGPISPRLLSGILYGVSDYLSKLEIEDEKISTQININSPGPIDFNIIGIFNTVKDAFPYLFGLLVMVGGGSAFAFKVPGVIDIIKEILLLPEEKRKMQAEAEGIELDNLKKKVEIYNEIKSLGIQPENLVGSIDTIAQNAELLDVQPLENNNHPVTEPIPETSVEDQPEDEPEDE